LSVVAEEGEQQQQLVSRELVAPKDRIRRRRRRSWGKERGNPFHHNVLFFFGLGSYKWGVVSLYLFDNYKKESTWDSFITSFCNFSLVCKYSLLHFSRVFKSYSLLSLYLSLSLSLSLSLCVWYLCFSHSRSG
jgi:hypothetical protein